DDVLIAGAAAEIAFDAVADLGVGGRRVALQQLFRSHDHAGRAEAALQAMLIPESLLHVVQMAIGGEALDGEEAAAVGLHGEHGAGFDGLAVHLDGAGAADGSLAADMGAGESDHLPKVVDEKQAGLHFVLVALAVDGEADLFLPDWLSSISLYAFSYQ